LYYIEYTSNFKNQFKRLIKKYPKSETEFKLILEELEKGNLLGVAYDNLGLPETEDVFKIMVANVDTNRSPKNGFRLIYYVIKNDTIFLLAVYSKSEVSNLKQSEIKTLIKKYCV
jgi:mRNA-degrading endonuclease YafQ of YafQ-DinJ toxin-antitoxin module